VGVAVADGPDVLAEASIETDRRHAEELTPMLISVAAKAGVELGDLDRLAVDIGPGRFTGLRVGLATIRTLAFALDLEVVGVSSLELLAKATPETDVAAVIDARRAEVFQQLFQNGKPVSEAAVGDPQVLSAQLGDAVVACGDGADRFSDNYPNRIESMVPSAALLAVLSAERESSPGPEVTPLYMRAPDVQINIKTRPTS
jgi:tRNA threonylcarbamoyladenosine biosynthesis protein TsaB